MYWDKYIWEQGLHVAAPKLEKANWVHDDEYKNIYF